MNQKKQLLFPLFFFFLFFPIEAQKSAFRNETPHELRAGIGIYPLAFEEWGCEEIYYNDYNYNYSPNYYAGDKVHSPSINLAYSYRLNYRFSFEANFSYARTDQKYYDFYSDRRISKESQQYFSIMPVVRLHWYTSRWISLYSSAGIGWYLYREASKPANWRQKRSENRLSGTFNYFGITVGKRLYGYTELSVGTTGMVLIGVGYRLHK